MNWDLAKRSPSTLLLQHFQSNSLAQIFLVAFDGKCQAPKDLAAAVWAVLFAQGEVIINDGKPLNSTDKNLTELECEASVFAQN